LDQVVFLLQVHLRQLAHGVRWLLVLRVEERPPELGLHVRLLTGGLRLRALLVFAAARRGSHRLLLRGNRLLVLPSHIRARLRHRVCRGVLLLQIQLLRLVQGLGLRLLLLVLESAILHVYLDALGLHI